jgi:acetyltransferase-like isoleucine patch superfamily enzyme
MNTRAMGSEASRRAEGVKPSSDRGSPNEAGRRVRPHSRAKLLVRALISAGSAILPWPLRRLLLRGLLGWRLHPTSHIGLSVILADHVVLEEGARIGRFNLIMPVGLVHLHAYATLGHSNRLGAAQRTEMYLSEPDRRSALIIEEHAAVTRGHLIDCSNTITIGRFTTFAGYNSQILTHSPDLASSTQHTRPVRIGAYCFVGTGCIVLYGAELPDYSVLSAGSVLTRKCEETHRIYSGNPAVAVKELPADLHYFHRTVGRFAA